MKTTVDKLKFGQKFRYIDDSESEFIFIYKNDNAHLFIEENECPRACCELEDHKYFDSNESTEIRRLLLKLNRYKYEWNLNSYDKVELLVVKNNKLNRKLYPNNEIT